MSERLPEVALPSGSLCIADVHLDGTDAASVQPFARWVSGLCDVPVLAVLGDLFDVWIGPAQAELPGSAAALAALAGLRVRGTRICVVPGNRDFLLGRAFELLTGAEIFGDGFVGRIERSGAPALRALCVHGDALCTRDRGYQRLRRVLRSGAVTAVAPRLPRSLGLAVARRLRRASARALAAKPPDDKSIQIDAVLSAARAHGTDIVVCGHAHAFRDERLEGGLRWIVLDAFGGGRDVVEIVEPGSIRIGSAKPVPTSTPAPGSTRIARVIIAIDGPAAAGKSTVSRAVAEALGLSMLDTGAMYRAVTLAALEQGVDPADAENCSRVARSIALEFDERGGIRIDGRPAEPAIRGPEVTRAVSQVSAHPGVRAAIVPSQRATASARGGIVAEGRDIGTVVFPDADFKFYLDASAEERARRRAAEERTPERYTEILADIRRRDRLDSTRADSPLAVASDAVRIETDGLGAGEVVREILARIQRTQAAQT